MTWTLKQRPHVAGSPIVAEYECPVHGRFEATVDRDELGDPPPFAACGYRLRTIADMDARFGGEVAALSWLPRLGLKEWGPDGTVPCGLVAPWRISAPSLKRDSVPCYAAARGGDTDRRPGMLDTRSLAEGGSVKEWKAKQQAARHERRHHELIRKGLKTRRVQV